MTKLDLLTLHGINQPLHLEYALTCVQEARQMQQEGLIGHVGFSTHAPVGLILEAIKTDLFDYVNLHYHFCGARP